jgi:hypothetical protein
MNNAGGDAERQAEAGRAARSASRLGRPVAIATCPRSGGRRGGGIGHPQSASASTMRRDPPWWTMNRRRNPRSLRPGLSPDAFDEARCIGIDPAFGCGGTRTIQELGCDRLIGRNRPRGSAASALARPTDVRIRYHYDIMGRLRLYPRSILMQVLLLRMGLTHNPALLFTHHHVLCCECQPQSIGGGGLGRRAMYGLRQLMLPRSGTTAAVIAAPAGALQPQIHSGRPRRRARLFPAAPGQGLFQKRGLDVVIDGQSPLGPSIASPRGL